MNFTKKGLSESLIFIIFDNSCKFFSAKYFFQCFINSKDCK